MATPSTVIDQLLADMRTAIIKKRCVPINRKKNMDTLALLGITWQDAFDEMMTWEEQKWTSTYIAKDVAS